MLISKEDIHKVIPQRDPMVLIDDLLEQSQVKSVTQFVVPEGHVLLDGDELSESGLIENIAQSAAAGVGYEYFTKNEPAPVGFIGAVSKLQIMRRPKIAQKLETTIEVTHQLTGITVIQGTSTIDGELAATCEMKIFLQ
jgi:predicted hotdog family 3-hydroxylacyl-ACP dehydratase